MSGPKVVRIVTREEMEAICRREIAFARAAADELVRICADAGRPTGDIEIGAHHSLEQLTALLSAGRYLDVQKQAPEVAAFMRSESDRITHEAIAATEADHQRRRRLADSATSLIDALKAAQQPVPADLSAVCATLDGADEATLVRLRAVLDQAFRLLVPVHTAERLGEDGMRLAERLAAEQGVAVTLEQWTSLKVPSEPSEARIQTAVATLDALTDVDSAVELRARLEAMRRAPSDKRALIADSLLLEASRRVRRIREETSLRSRLCEAKAGLEAVGTTASLAHAVNIEGVLEGGDFTEAERLLSEAAALSEREVANIAAIARRKSVLTGLASLGYEVREGMMTAWVRDGRVVVRKPGMTDYGVEIGAPTDVSRLQVRLVGSDRPATPRNNQRDLDHEVAWCSEVGQLEEIIRGAGGAFFLDRSSEPGAHAVKTVRFENDPVAHATGSLATNERRWT